MTPPVPRLHAVTDDAVAAGAGLEAAARAIARPGIALHARAPRAGGRRQFDLATQLAALARAGGAAIQVNDRLDIARAVGAGIHLPALGLPVRTVRALVGGDVLLGCSVHSADDARRAADAGADYVFLGPIWETASHPGRRGLGPAALRGLAPVRVIAIGGVTADRVAACRAAGAWGVAAVRALWHSADPAAAAEAMLVSLGNTQ